MSDSPNDAKLNRTSMSGVGSDAGNQWPVAHAIAAAGLIEPKHYFTLANSREAGGTPFDAAVHWYRWGAKAGISPHPLLDLDHFPDDVIDDLRDGDVSAYLEYLRSPAAATHAWSEFFDPRSLAVEAGLEAIEFIRALADADALPVPAEYVGPVPTWGQVRDGAAALKASAAAASAAAGVAARRPTTASTAVDDVLAAGLFDFIYYSRITTSRTPMRASHGAAAHWVKYGAKAGLPSHPLIELEYLPKPVRDELFKGDVAQYVNYFYSDDALTRAWGPLFDPRVLEVTSGEVALEILRKLGPHDAPPVPKTFVGDAPSLRQARRTAIAMHRQRMAQRGNVVVPAKQWDGALERAWRSANTVDQPSFALVSVVLPVRNRALELPMAIASVKAQTHGAWELLIVDDGSTDETRDIAHAYAAKDPRVRVIERDHAGVGSARNAAVSEATGEYIAFLDSDNEWTAEHLALSVAALEKHPEVVATYSVLRITSKDGVTYLGGQVGEADLAVGNSIDLNALVARASDVHAEGGFDLSIRRWVDYDLALRLSSRGPLMYLPFIGVEYANAGSEDRITNRESSNWQFVVMAKHVVRWEKSAKLLDARIPGRVSVVVLAYEDHVRTLRAVNQVLNSTPDDDVEVVIVDNGSRAAVSRVLSSAFQAHPRVSFHRLARNYNFAAGANYGFIESSGEFVFFLNNDVELRPNWLPPLLRRLQSSSATAVQPLLLYPDGTVQTAGTIFASSDGLPCHFLARFPPQDARRHTGKGFSAITAGAMLIRARDFHELRGFDPIFANGSEDIDFCLRAKRDLGATFEVESQSMITHEESASPGRFAREAENRRLFLERWGGQLPGPDRAYHELGFGVPHLKRNSSEQYPIPRPMVVRLPRLAENAAGDTVPSYRWAIKIGANSSQAGDKWGDVPFAEDLAEALTSLGQEVVIDRVDAHTRTTTYLDDINLVIRGSEAVRAQPGRLNILWVISRADTITTDEVQQFDLVYAASEKWAAWMSTEAEKPVEVLLQATNSARFKPDLEDVEEPSDVLFVGGARIQEEGRKLVNAALSAGVSVDLWGPNWERFAPVENVRGEFLEFEQTPRAYASAGIVLNDHLADMAEWGFVNNRTFDAVASGTPVISDPVDGLEMFDGAVATAASPGEVKTLLEDRSWIPDPEALSAISERVRREHSFTARAERFLHDATTWLTEKPLH